MNKSRFVLTAVVFFSCLSVLHAKDKVKTSSEEYSGEITLITKDGIQIKVGREKKTIPLPEILPEPDSVRFTLQHSSLTLAQRKMKTGDFKGALELLLGVPGADRTFIQQEIDFNIAKCAMRIRKRDGTAKMIAFVTNHTSSYHYYEGNEMLADYAVEIKRADLAIRYYTVLSRARWPEIKLKGLLGIANVKFEIEKKYDEAKKDYKNVKNAPGGTEQFKLAGSLGMARCDIKLGHADQAIPKIQEVIKAADPQYERMHAQAYNALGNGFLGSKRADKTKQALWAFLIVDIVYSAYPKEHAEALSNLATLWGQVNKADRASDARRRMKAYGNAP